MGINNSRGLFTRKIVNATYTASGASIDIVNVGVAKGAVTGNARYNDTASEAVDVPISGSYTLEYNSGGYYKDILIDATGTELHLAIKI